MLHSPSEIQFHLKIVVNISSVYVHVRLDAQAGRPFPRRLPTLDLKLAL
jgi:hypothetical protein